jgi:hypothetical protein
MMQASRSVKIALQINKNIPIMKQTAETQTPSPSGVSAVTAVSQRSKVPALVKPFIAANAGAPKALKSELKSRAISKVVYKEGDELPSNVESLDIAKRPLVMRDLAGFRARHKRTVADSIRDLALPTTSAYPKDAIADEADHVKSQRGTAQNRIMPFDLELLVRLYDLLPSPCPWNYLTISSVYDKMYRELIFSFEEMDQPAAQLAYRRRFALLIGRSVTGAYRWKKRETTTRRMEILLTKINDLGKTGKDIRIAFESLSLKTWALRGINMDKEAPAPTPVNVQKPPGTRGRKINNQLPVKADPAPAKYLGGAFS